MTNERLERAILSLERLSVGERFFVHPYQVQQLIAEWALPAPPWNFTDDTQMEHSIVAVLARHGTIMQDEMNLLIYPTTFRIDPRIS